MDTWGNNRGHFLQRVDSIVPFLQGVGGCNKSESKSLSSLCRKSALPREAVSVQAPTERTGGSAVITAPLFGLELGEQASWS